MIPFLGLLAFIVIVRVMAHLTYGMDSADERNESSWYE